MPYNPDVPESQMPKSWDVPDSTPAFPEGYYLGVLGGLHVVYDETMQVKAMNSDIYMLKFLGTDTNPVDQVRVTIKDGKVLMATKGVKLVERYPNPATMPNMAWRARAFFSSFNCIVETETGRFNPDGSKEIKSSIDWQLVKAAYGTVFKFYIIYQKSKKDNKSYRNIQYESISIIDQKVPSDDMKKIEEEYEMMRKKEEIAASGTGEVAPPSANDLPF